MELTNVSLMHRGIVALGLGNAALWVYLSVRYKLGDISELWGSQESRAIDSIWLPVG